VQNVTAKALNVAPVVVQQPFNVSVSGGNITFSFIGRFVDNNNKQTFAINYVNPSGQSVTWDATYTKVKSLLTPNSFSQIFPNSTTITAPLCQITNHNISFNNVQFGNPWENPPIGYGIITDYEYLLPTGWSLNGTPSTGNWIAANNNVIITSDATSGNGTNIRIRPINTQCGIGLQTGQEAVVSISRPAPPLNMTGPSTMCFPNNYTYTINGVPVGSTISWGTNSFYNLTSSGNTATISPTSAANGSHYN
jgi:hypothetical protein